MLVLLQGENDRDLERELVDNVTGSEGIRAPEFSPRPSSVFGEQGPAAGLDNMPVAGQGIGEPLLLTAREIRSVRLQALSLRGS